MIKEEKQTELQDFNKKFKEIILQLEDLRLKIEENKKHD